ncbi:MAG: glycosyltransferase, partial [Anaerolineales bacterium]|nr:glycosyltransferase [Anaerolineales bacterium]
MTEQPPRVLHLIHGLTVGGAEVDLLQKCAILTQHYGYDFTVVCLLRRGELAAQFEALGITVVDPLMRHRYDIAAGWALRHLLRTDAAPILHTHLAAANLIGWLINRTLRPSARKILLAGEHAMAERWPAPVLWLDRRLARTGRVLVPTQATRNSYIRRGVP